MGKENENYFEYTNNTADNAVSSKIEELAKELAYNYFSNSLGDSEDMENVRTEEIFNSNVKEEFASRINNRDRVRNIMVIGSGCSYDAYKAIPLGAGLIQETKREYENDIRSIDFLTRKFEKEEEEIFDLTGKKRGIDQLSFENYLSLLNSCFVTQDDLREKIKEMTEFRYSYSLFNETVAHMLKHGYLDIVINFNFEETLDFVIEQEIGRHNYHHILYDGNCVDISSLLVDGRLKMPIYIKPHGTYSHKSTLRFTNRHYFDLPDDLKKMLEALVSGRRGKKDIQRVNFIVAGFAMESLEFNKIVNKCLPSESVIYHIDKAPMDDEESIGNFLKQRGLGDFAERAKLVRRSLTEIYRRIPLGHFSQNKACECGMFKKEEHKQEKEDEKKKDEIKKNEEKETEKNLLTSPLSELFSVIWRKQDTFFMSHFWPRSIGRHELLSYLFFRPDLSLFAFRKEDWTNVKDVIPERTYIKEQIETNPKYFRDRLLVEIALLLHRNNGILDVAEILKGKTGRLYSLYLSACNTFKSKIKQVHSIYELIQQFASGSDIATLSSKMSFTLDYTLREDLVVSVRKDIQKLTDKLREVYRKVYFPREYEPISKIPVDSVNDERINDLTDETKELLDAYLERDKGDRSKLIRLGDTIKIVERLFTTELLSNNFKFNFLLNFDKTVFNGRKEKITMLHEFFRILLKSWHSHYYIIDSKPNNPVHYMFEGFSKSKLIHTNLSRTYEFYRLFKRTDWNTLLMVSDTGSTLKSICHNFSVEKAEVEITHKTKKHILLICSLESIRQLHRNSGTLSELLQIHKNYLEGECCFGNMAYSLEIVVLAIPFNQHNHHTSIFLRSLPQDNWMQILKEKITVLEVKPEENAGTTDRRTIRFASLGGIYYYRRGFSNSIDPFMFGEGHNEITSDYYTRDLLKTIESFLVLFKSAVLTDDIPNIFERNLNRFMEAIRALLNDPQATNRMSLKDSEKIRNQFLRLLYQYVESTNDSEDPKLPMDNS